MQLNKVDLNLFIALDVIYSQNSLTRAAEILHVTQPAMSNTLRRLRETFNDQLFVRTPDGMLPTPVADNVIDRVRQALQLLGSSLNEYDQFEASSSDKTFCLAMGDLAEALLLPQLLQKIESLAPRISLRSFTIPRSEIAMALANNTIDLAVEPPLISNSQLLNTPLIEDGYVCVLRKNHPIRTEPLTLERYLTLSHLHLSSRRRGIGHVDLALKGLGKRRHIAMRVQHYMVAPIIINKTNLALSIPLSLAKQLELDSQPLPFETQPLQLHLFWHKSTDNDPANLWLRRLFNLTQFDLGVPQPGCE